MCQVLRWVIPQKFGAQQAVLWSWPVKALLLGLMSGVLRQARVKPMCCTLLTWWKKSMRWCSVGAVRGGWMLPQVLSVGWKSRGLGWM